MRSAADIQARATRLSDELDDEGWPTACQVPICGSVLVSALMVMTPQERRKALHAHLICLGEMMQEVTR